MQFYDDTEFIILILAPFYSSYHPLSQLRHKIALRYILWNALCTDTAVPQVEFLASQVYCENCLRGQACEDSEKLQFQLGSEIITFNYTHKFLWHNHEKRTNWIKDRFRNPVLGTSFQNTVNTLLERFNQFDARHLFGFFRFIEHHERH
jgi:hypothetical protein